MIILTQTVEEFAARRRTAQTEIEDALRPSVEEGVDLGTDTHGWDEVLDTVEEVYASTYHVESGETTVTGPEMGWKTQLRETLQKSTRDEHTADRITVWLATWILSQATFHAVQADEENLWLEWVDMGDDSVRPAHRDASGQQRPAGEPFDVGGVEMLYPGWPGAPIELWINCRCTLRPVLAAEAEEALVATDTSRNRLGNFAPADAPLHTKPFRDVSSKERDRLADEGKALPDGSFPIANCSDLRNAIQAIGRAKDPGKAKAHIRKRKRALGCPDVDLPESWAVDPFREAREAAQRITYSTLEERTRNTCIVALPKEGQSVHQIGEEQKHVTLAFLGEADADVETVAAAVEGVAGSMEPFTAMVSGQATLGPDKAKVLLVEEVSFQTARDRLLDNDEISAAVSSVDSHPHFVPHMTLTYEDAMPEFSETEIVFDRLALWHGEEQTEYALGGVMAETEREMPPSEDVEDPCDNRDPETGECLDEADEEEQDRPFSEGLVPWHGVLAPEGIRSGDGRSFASGALRFRPLPLPLTWQKISDDGHKGNVTVARIDTIVRVDGEMRASGVMLATPEADEVMGLLADFGRFGVSVDADEAQMELSEDEEEVVFTDARISSACIVPIPAFAQAWVALGEAPEGFLDGEGVVVEEGEADPALVAAAPVAEFIDVAPGRTEDGPGWLTHPVDTDRLRDYWVRGPGAAKIAWGAPGDFNRCRVNLAEYVKPQHLNGYCANRHYDALGYWPGQGPHAAAETEELALEHTEPAEAIHLVAAAPPAPVEMFANPALEKPTPITVEESGHVYGHLATWGTCHIGFEDQCITPPQSASGYAYFLTGEVCLSDGSRVPVGNITIGGGHAGPRLSARAALAHYDSTSTVVADVTCGEDEHGIWLSGRIRPEAPDEMVAALQAAALSGDWRKVAGSMELVAALAVNVPGFPIPRTQIAASAEGQVSLVAAGIVERTEEAPAFDVDQFAEAVAEAIEARQQRREKMAALAARLNGAQ